MFQGNVGEESLAGLFWISQNKMSLADGVDGEDPQGYGALMPGGPTR